MRSPGRKPRLSPASTAGLSEDDLLHIAALEQADRVGDGQICLSGPGDAGREHDIVSLHALAQVALPQRLGIDGLALGGPADGLGLVHVKALQLPRIRASLHR